MKKWRNIKPHSEKSRKTMKSKYGKSCFLDASRLKYPICNKFTGKKECVGLYASDYYLNINISKLKKKLKNRTTKKIKNNLTRKLRKLKSLKNKSDKYKKKLCS